MLILITNYYYFSWLIRSHCFDSLYIAWMGFKLKLLYIIVITYNFVYSEKCQKKYQIQESQEMFSNVLTFIEQKYYEFNYDGLLGIVIAEGKVNTFVINSMCLKFISS